MIKHLEWIRTHKFEAYLAAFLSMVLPPIPMYVAAQRGATGWVWLFLGVVTMGNLLALVIK